ncbi:uncharacterized protein LOC133534411 isoform X3 [Cydia pomonella]|uniref:uncharacterized protein LOC133534411 isoform X3 n=1 Tax=Cydia pomonella TaxID=82600 RepID=UPI002ADD3896|nr:uncharacterized protein LOC133534411 isoform X3 [Cydia pomonella]
MEGGRRQLRLLGRLLGKLRGGNNTFEKRLSTSSGVLFPTTISNSESTMTDDEDAAPSDTSSRNPLGANIDLRYSGQCLTPEQLPEFCNQLHHLVEVIRNIQSYGKITGEYPSELEKRLEEEARELAALAAEARNARDVVTRTRAQRRAVRAQKKQLVAHLATLKETETRELENSIRLADRKFYLSWEALKDSTDPTALDPLLEEVKEPISRMTSRVPQARSVSTVPNGPSKESGRESRGRCLSRANLADMGRSNRILRAPATAWAAPRRWRCRPSNCLPAEATGTLSFSRSTDNNL